MTSTSHHPGDLGPAAARGLWLLPEPAYSTGGRVGV